MPHRAGRHESGNACTTFRAVAAAERRVDGRALRAHAGSVSRSLFIVFEGIDGSGTTTQCDLLAAYVRAELGHPVVRTREPGGTPLGEAIRALVLDPSGGPVGHAAELFLYAAARAQHASGLIAPALGAGRLVVCDRYADSTMAYQGYGRGLDREMVATVNCAAVGGCTPDATIYLDLPVDAARERRERRGKSPDRLEAAGDELQERVRRGYLEIARQNPSAPIQLDGSLGPHDLEQRIRSELRARWPAFPLKH